MAIWLPGLAVALAAAVATAHGLYEVAVAARVPAALAWLYPVMTDGLALVAYAATARLRAGAARYAWAVVVLAAGLSGLAQAAFLAGDTAVSTPPMLRFGVGAWPAVAAAIVAHLLYLLATDGGSVDHRVSDRTEAPDRSTGQRTAVQPGTSGCTPAPAVPARTEPRPVQHPVPARPAPVPPVLTPPAPRPADRRTGAAPARERARTAAEAHRARTREWPTVSEVETAAGVSRGTAAAALKELRELPTPLHLVTEQATDTEDQQARP
ncbi:hypothetical protein AD006_25265 [Pseudonocardia sp. EC080610-09]|nr:hypothetical protein FRP1_17820 [Pseudonocardia sp. EC080625-04]ALL77790.1 hypothetical protein AD006_25265 [Pseudonocardia sp. EC080610-09]ALL80705.1 hypothetical protein AD017_04855 [Pseudonocardia sp. EC080619-01]